MERWLANHFSVYLKDSDERKAVRDFCLLWAVFEGSLFDGHWSVESGRRVVGNLELGGEYMEASSDQHESIFESAT
jgi:hypothetical protein